MSDDRIDGTDGAEVIRFPVWERNLQEDRKNHRVRCSVSPRSLKFGEVWRHEGGDHLTISVMTTGETDIERKLCEIHVDPNELLRVLAGLPVNDRRQK